MELEVEDEDREERGGSSADVRKEGRFVFLCLVFK